MFSMLSESPIKNKHANHKFPLHLLHCCSRSVIQRALNTDYECQDQEDYLYLQSEISRQPPYLYQYWFPFILVKENREQL